MIRSTSTSSRRRFTRKITKAKTCGRTWSPPRSVVSPPARPPSTSKSTNPRCNTTSITNSTPHSGSCTICKLHPIFASFPMFSSSKRVSAKKKKHASSPGSWRRASGGWLTALSAFFVKGVFFFYRKRERGLDVTHPSHVLTVQGYMSVWRRQAKKECFVRLDGPINSTPLDFFSLPWSSLDEPMNTTTV
ncbi:mitochondrial hypoxia responsive domain-containing protein [Colletotrichum higginsianum]|uniref:Mitochondrial hypoxia responsive domain-containing protein n=1 Tax=Colletotrichum higginsianum (strain IMI 349063) TaxID=759273 RepID=H1V1I0_COLHI|nr:mitochondrial hypoxia responsive domain-containing protein [Colletotrichum higginsianum]